MPIYILSYRYRDKVYRFLINGQTGKAAGDKPLSGTRIALRDFSLILVILIFVLIAMLVQSPRSKVQRPVPDLPTEAPP